jgi:N6-adenosine-specific RNA methylase IME4
LSGHIQPGPTLMPGEPRYESLREIFAAYAADPVKQKQPGEGSRFIHPFANFIPMMSEEHYPALRSSLETGQNHSVIFYCGALADGRNRSRGLIDNNKPISTVNFTGTDLDLLKFLKAENLERRHLSIGQRADYASRVARYEVGANQHTKAAPIGAPTLALVTDDAPAPASLPIMSQTEAAQEYGVSRRTLQRYETVLDKGAPELQAAVQQGKVAVGAAVEIAALPIEEQKRIIASADKKAVKEVAKANRIEKQTASRERRLANMRTPGALDLIEGKKYGVHLIDIPREFVSWGDETGAEKSPHNHYRVEGFQYLADLRAKLLACSAPNCVAVMWAWANSLQDQFDLLAEWGFASVRRRDDNGLLLRDDAGKILQPVGEGRYRSHQVWAKRNADGSLHRGTGFWFIDGHELMLYGARGDVPAPLMGTQARSLLDLPIGDHSEKPSEHIRYQIDAYFPGVPKLEWFARVPDLAAFKARHPDWDVTGNEAGDPEQQQLGIEPAEEAAA